MTDSLDNSFFLFCWLQRFFLIKREFVTKLQIWIEQFQVVIKHSHNFWQEGRVLKMALFRSVYKKVLGTGFREGFNS